MKTKFIAAILLSAALTSAYSANLAAATKTAAPHSAAHISADKLVTVYLLLDKPATLTQYINDLNNLSNYDNGDGRPNFNRVILSFVRPTLTNYQTGNLANTGILGYFDQGDGNGQKAFDQLKTAIQLSHQKNIQVFLSVGGWNYSCNYAVYGSKCGAPPSNQVHYDYFPNPNDPNEQQTAVTSYKNLVQLANDLGVDGIDFDYEEFWHADKYAVKWGGSPYSTMMAQQILQDGGAHPSYATLMKDASVGTGNTSFVMPATIDKVDAILHLIIDNPAAKNLLFSTAAPPVGARPITGFVYSDDAKTIYTQGGLWWGGNLKGLWYNLTDKDPTIVSHFDSLGLMTYDLCDNNAQTCAPYAGGPLDLPGQVGAYMQDYLTWLKAKTTSSASLTISNDGKVTFLPAIYNINAKIQFGFEVNKPAYPSDDDHLQLTKALVDQITKQEQDSGGVIIWQMYSVPNDGFKDYTTVKYTINQSCKTFLAGDTRYNCTANFPSSVAP